MVICLFLWFWQTKAKLCEKPESTIVGFWKLNFFIWCFSRSEKFLLLGCEVWPFTRQRRSVAMSSSSALYTASFFFFVCCFKRSRLFQNSHKKSLKVWKNMFSYVYFCFEHSWRYNMRSSSNQMMYEWKNFHF